MNSTHRPHEKNLNTQDSIPWLSEAIVWRDLNHLIVEQLADDLPIPEAEPEPTPEIQVAKEVVQGSVQENAEDNEQNSENESIPDIEESEEEDELCVVCYDQLVGV